MAVLQPRFQALPLLAQTTTTTQNRSGMKTSHSGIPVVTQQVIKTDQDLGLCQSSTFQPVNLKRVIKLLTDPHSQTLHDRHAYALNRMVQHYKQGFPMKDLAQVFKILNICADRVDSVEVYEQPFIGLLKICGLSFLMEKASNELIYKQLAVESVSQLGYFMRIPLSAVRIQICHTLLLLSTLKNLAECMDFKPTDLNFNKKLIEESDVCETLVKSLTMLTHDLPAQLKLIEVLQLFSKHSDKNCNQMLSAEGGKKICLGLMDPDPSGQLLFRSVDLLWNLIESGDPAILTKQLNSVSCLSKLRDAFVYQLTQGHNHFDRQLRNDLLILVTLIAFHCPDAPFVETGLAKQLTLFATFQEVKSHSALVRHLKLLTNQEDFELKKLLFNILVVLSQNRAMKSILSENHLLLALFSYVRANEMTSLARDWSVAQFEELQLQAMASLCALCPLLLDNYMTCQGSTRLLLLLEWCVGPDEFCGQGNSFFGKCGRGSKKAQMCYCLQLLRSIVSTKDEQVIQDLADQGAINQLIVFSTKWVLNTSFNQKTEEDDEVTIEMQTDIMFILSCLCEGDVHRKELFGVQGVDMVTRYLQMDTKLMKSGLGHHKLLLASIDCTWCAVVGCFLAEDYFLEKEGVFQLFDLLEFCPTTMHSLILGCLIDLCENPKTVSHILTWRGKDGRTASRFLCEMWRQEEAKMGVKRDSNGVLDDLNKPLMGRFQAESSVVSLPAPCMSQAIAEVGENLRAKIFCLFCKMGFTELPGITVKDHITLAIIEKYLDFKNGEVWLEIFAELDADNIRPVTEDLEALEAIVHGIKERAEIVQEVQKEMLQAEINQDLLDEQQFYSEIRENYRQREKAITDFADFVARTSNFATLKAAKDRQNISIDMSRIHSHFRNTEHFHNTEIPNLTATVFSGKHVSVVNPDSLEETSYRKEVRLNMGSMKHLTV